MRRIERKKKGDPDIYYITDYYCEHGTMPWGHVADSKITYWIQRYEDYSHTYRPREGYELNINERFGL